MSQERRHEGPSIIIFEPNATPEQVARALWKLEEFFFGSKEPNSKQEEALEKNQSSPQEPGVASDSE